VLKNVAAKVDGNEKFVTLDIVYECKRYEFESKRVND